MKHSYNPFQTWFNFILVIVIFFIPIIFLIYKVTNEKGLIFVLILLLSFGFFCFKMLINFYRFILKKPAIELTNEFYFDNLNNIKIDWRNISDIELKKYKNWTFITFNLKDKTQVFNQIKNPILKLIYRIESTLSSKNWKTNISLVKGKKQEIFNTINEFYLNNNEK